MYSHRPKWPKTKSHRLVIAVAPAALRCAVRFAKALVTCATRRNGDLEDLEDLGFPWDMMDVLMGNHRKTIGKWWLVVVSSG